LVLSRDGQSVLVAVLGYTRDPMTPPAGAVLKYDLNGNLVGTVASGLPIASSIALGVQRGDSDLDGSITAADIQGEMVALSDLVAYAAAHHLTDDEMTIVADVDGDGTVTNADLQALINRLANSQGSGSLTAVPEPSALLLASMGLVAILSIRARGSFDRG
jgi:hypothetical protein